MKINCFLLFFCLISLQSKGQLSVGVIGSYDNKTIAISNSPTASNFRIFGDFPPSNYIGVADVEIPVYTINHRDFNFPMVLRYHNGMGNKVEMQPGVTGLGWHLNSGGAITLIDDKRRIKAGTETGGTQGIQENMISNENWSSKQYLKGILGGTGEGLTINVNYNKQSLIGSVFAVNFNGFSGELYFDHNEKPKFRTKEGVFFEVKIDFIDEHTKYFTIPLFFGNQTQILCRDEVFRFTLIDSNGIQYVFGGDENSIEFSTLGHNSDLSFEKAYTNPEKEVIYNAVKTVPTTWHLTKIVLLNRESFTFNYIRQQPIYTSHVLSFLREVEMKNSKEFESFFNREHEHINEEQATLVNPVLLSSIVTPSQTVVFDYGLSSNHNSYSGGVYDNFLDKYTREKNYTISERNKKNISFFLTQINPGNTSFYELTTPIQKIKKIRVLNSEKNIFKSIDFEYLLAGRAKLKNLVFKGYNGGQVGQTEIYSFKYDMPLLGSPDYHSYNRDDYGFYNSKTGYLGYLDDVHNIPELRSNEILKVFKNSSTLRNNYVVSRKPEVTKFNTWEILTEIVYPSGGYTKFEYEPNRFGGIARDYRSSGSLGIDTLFTVEKTSYNADNVTGGVRIKRVRNYDFNEKLISSKSFAYVKNYAKGSEESSGVLTHIPTYFDVLTSRGLTNFENFNYISWSSDDLYPANRLRGNHITYSEVTEIDDVDKSFTTYKYKNFDNGYHDSKILNYATHYENAVQHEDGKKIWQTKDIISMDLERGQLLSKMHYKAKVASASNFSKGILVKEYRYDYNNSKARFDDYIRTLNVYDNHVFSQAVGTIHSWTYIASLIYTYTPYLKKETIIDYPNGASVGLVNSETTYQYHEKYKSLTEKLVKKGDKTYKTTYKYPYDFAGVYADMTAKNIIVPVIEQQEFINGVKSTAVKTNYFKFYPEILKIELMSQIDSKADRPIIQMKFLFVPASIQTQHRNRNWQTQIEFLEYDDKGNVLSVKNSNGLITNYIFGYNKTLPIWQIENVPYSAISDALTGAALDAFSKSLTPDISTMSVFENVFAQNPILNKTFISKFLYDPMLGLIYKKSASGVVEYYKYDQNGRLKQVEDSNNNILIKYEHNYRQN